MSTITEIEHLICQLVAEVTPMKAGEYVFSMKVTVMESIKGGSIMIVPGPAHLEATQ